MSALPCVLVVSQRGSPFLEGHLAETTTHDAEQAKLVMLNLGMIDFLSTALIRTNIVQAATTKDIIATKSPHRRRALNK